MEMGHRDSRDGTLVRPMTYESKMDLYTTGEGVYGRLGRRYRSSHHGKMNPLWTVYSGRGEVGSKVKEPISGSWE